MSKQWILFCDFCYIHCHYFTLEFLEINTSFYVYWQILVDTWRFPTFGHLTHLPSLALPNGAEAEAIETARNQVTGWRQISQLVTITNYRPGLHLHGSPENSFWWESLFIPSFNKYILEREWGHRVSGDCAKYRDAQASLKVFQRVYQYASWLSAKFDLSMLWYAPWGQ